ncbi:MAG: hypothetical protein LBG60_09400 [Bifidobacteriaceae bacterium]|nr:hypothetical protein [Bifidobacteriaceae bacterium]
MNAATTQAPPRARRQAEKSQSTSIRVAKATRDILAREAAEAGISLAAYLDRVAAEAELQRVFAEYREHALIALQDPEFVEELMDWENADLGVDYGDDDWPEFNER